MKYRLTCKCGRCYPVETRQAGGSLVCEDCHETLQIPTMLKMKRLPEWEDDSAAIAKPSDAAPEQAPNAAPSETAQTASQAAAETASSDAKAKTSKRGKMSAKRTGQFIVAALFFVVSTICVGVNLPKPDPSEVFDKKTDYRLEDGRKIRRDSSPITPEDYQFYYAWDPILQQGREINDEVIDNLTLDGAYNYFYYVKNLDMSDNFYDNYEAILTRWRLTLSAFGFVAVASLIVALLALFVKESNKQVGAMRGDNWN